MYTRTRNGDEEVARRVTAMPAVPIDYCGSAIPHGHPEPCPPGESEPCPPPCGKEPDDPGKPGELPLRPGCRGECAEEKKARAGKQGLHSFSAERE